MHFSYRTTTASFWLRTTAVSHGLIVANSRKRAARQHRMSSAILQSVINVHGEAWNGISTPFPVGCQKTRFQLLAIPVAIYGYSRLVAKTPARSTFGITGR